VLTGLGGRAGGNNTQNLSIYPIRHKYNIGILKEKKVQRQARCVLAFLWM
jgi:hypothetical protein